MSSDRADYFREYFRRRYYSDPDFRARHFLRSSGKLPKTDRPVDLPNGVGSIHHADESMLCPACQVEWPCEPFLEARQKPGTRKRNLVYPEQPGEVAGDGGRSTEAPLRAGRPGPRS